MCGALAVAALQLLWIQGIDAPSLAAESANQRTTTQVDPAVRGSITDRNGNPLAFTMEAKALTFQPVRVRKELEEARAKSIEQGAEGDKQAPEVSDRLAEIAAGIHAKLGDTVPEKDLLQKMNSNETFTYLARSVDPAVAAEISDKFREVGLERQDIREYPGGSLAANLVGATGWDGHGLLGLEDSMDSTLAGTDGSETYDRGSDGAVIPGSWRDKQPAVNGSGVELTIDSDLQFYVQQQVQIAKDKSAQRTLRLWSWTPRRDRCWPCPTTAPSTPQSASTRTRRQPKWAIRRSVRRSSRIGEQDRHRSSGHRGR